MHRRNTQKTPTVTYGIKSRRQRRACATSTVSHSLFTRPGPLENGSPMLSRTSSSTRRAGSFKRRRPRVRDAYIFPLTLRAPEPNPFVAVAPGAAPPSASAMVLNRSAGAFATERFTQPPLFGMGFRPSAAPCAAMQVDFESTRTSAECSRRVRVECGLRWRTSARRTPKGLPTLTAHR
jgi:hypothetical protein